MNNINSDIMKELIINGNAYKQRLTFIKEDKLWECAFVDDNGNIVDLDSLLLVSYDESAGSAAKELDEVIAENGLKYGENNEVTLWKSFDEKTQKKILANGSRLKRELMSDWHTKESLWEDWSRIMKARTGYTFSRGIFDRI